MNIEEYQDRDKEQVVTLIENIFNELSFSFDLKTTHKDLLDIENYFTKFFVIRVNEEVVGTIGVKMEESRVAGIKRLYLKNEHRGKGWGRALLEKALSFSRENGATVAQLRTTEKNKQALKIYIKNGFKEFKREGDYIYFQKKL